MNPEKTYNPWIARVLTALPALGLAASGAMKIAHAPDIEKMLVGTFGYPAGAVTPIGCLELLGVVLFVMPKTATLGAIWLTAYLGGAVATHVRAGDAWVAPVVFGVLIWAAMYFRDARVRGVFPLVVPPK